MKEITFVNSGSLETLEQYGAALVSGMLCLKTLEGFHIAAFKQGLLDEDEQETGKTICWEIQRLLSLYKTQVHHVLDRTAVDEAQILEALKKLMPAVKIPRRKKHAKPE